MNHSGGIFSNLPIDSRLKEIGESAVEPLIQALKDENGDVRGRVAEGLGVSGYVERFENIEFIHVPCSICGQETKLVVLRQERKSALRCFVWVTQYPYYPLADYMRRMLNVERP